MSLHEKVQRYFDEKYAIELLQRLVRVSSEAPPEDYEEMVELLRNEMSNVGLEVSTFRKPGEPNIRQVVGRFKGERGKPALCICNHFDTVPIGDQSKWTVDPLGGEIVDGRIYGRGAADQKVAIASCLSAVKTFTDSNIRLQGDLIILCQSHCEINPKYSLEYIAEAHPEQIKADWCLNTDLQRGMTLFVVGMGLIQLEITSKGVSGHVHAPGTVNAVSKMIKVLAAIERVNEWMSYKPHPRLPSGPLVEVGGKLELCPPSGVAINVVPAFCKATVDIRILPGQKPTDVLEELNNLISRLKKDDQELQIEIKTLVVNYPPYQIPEDHFIVHAVTKAAELVLGKKLDVVGSWRAGTREPLLRLMPVISFGPGGHNAHGADEYIQVDELLTYTRFLINLMVDLLH